MIHIDIHSKTWQTIKAHIDKKQEATLKSIIQEGCTSEQTQYLRGYYAALQEIKDMTTPPKAINQSGSYL